MKSRLHSLSNEIHQTQPSVHEKTGPAEKILFSRRAFVNKTLPWMIVPAAMQAVTPKLWKGTPLALASGHKPPNEKAGILIHNDRPLNGEFAPHLLDDQTTPTHRHFVRSNGLVPSISPEQAKNHRLVIDGNVHRKLSLSLIELKRMPSVQMDVVIECGGNGRALFQPPVRGNPWRRGAVACANWKGVLLKDLLKIAGLKDGSIYTAHFGVDPGLPGAEPFSRGIPIEKAIDGFTMVAYEMNGQPIPAYHGYPLRLIVPGWIGSCSQKWLNKISILTKVHDSEKMSGYAYRVPEKPIAPGKKPPENEMKIAKYFPVKSLVTYPKPMTEFKDIKTSVKIRGHAWAGEDEIKKVEVSTDFGRTWKQTQISAPRNRYAWYSFSGEVNITTIGYHEIWSRAFDQNGITQPMIQPWNPKGYLGNTVHRVPIIIGS